MTVLSIIIQTFVKRNNKAIRFLQMIIQYISKIRSNSEIDKIFKLVAPSSKDFAILLSRNIQVNILLISAHELLEQPLKTDFNSYTTSAFCFWESFSIGSIEGWLTTEGSISFFISIGLLFWLLLLHAFDCSLFFGLKKSCFLSKCFL